MHTSVVKVLVATRVSCHFAKRYCKILRTATAVKPDRHELPREPLLLLLDPAAHLIPSLLSGFDRKDMYRRVITELRRDGL